MPAVLANPAVPVFMKELRTTSYLSQLQKVELLEPWLTVMLAGDASEQSSGHRRYRTAAGVRKPTRVWLRERRSNGMSKGSRTSFGHGSEARRGSGSVQQVCANMLGCACKENRGGRATSPDLPSDVLGKQGPAMSRGGTELLLPGWIIQGDGL